MLAEALVSPFRQSGVRCHFDERDRNLEALHIVSNFVPPVTRSEDKRPFDLLNNRGAGSVPAVPPRRASSDRLDFRQADLNARHCDGGGVFCEGLICILKLLHVIRKHMVIAPLRLFVQAMTCTEYQTTR